jgi:radical SAM superfamily enzyme YgiQ (UPF0313 family)
MKILVVRAAMPADMEMEEPLGILYLIGYLKDYIQDLFVDLEDAHVTQKTPQIVAEQAICGNYDFILISALSVGSEYAYELIRQLRQNLKTTIIMGGVHATALPEECLLAGADYCVIGEGEATVTHLLKVLAANSDPISVDGIAFLNEGNMIRTKQREFIDLTMVGFPDFSLLPSMSLYKTHIHLHDNNEKALPIMASRGCINDCPFCSSNLMWHRKLRFRTVCNVMDEIEFAVMKYGVRHFHFHDDDLLINRSFVRSLCREIKRRQLAIEFCCLTTVKAFLALNLEEIEFLQESGMRVVEIGIESLMPEVLKYLGKTYTIEDIPILSTRICQFNIGLRPLIMYMVPCETYTGYQKQAKLFQKTLGEIPYLKEGWEINPFVFTTYASTYTPLPGTEFYHTARSLGMQLEQLPEKCNTDIISFLPNSLLEDRPKKNGELLSEHVHELIRQMKKHPSFPSAAQSEEYLHAVWLKIDAWRTSKEIAHELYLAYCTSMSHHQVFIATLLTLILLAESGLIFSG